MLQKFHNAYLYFCSHVLPLVYDESLSYYEVLCKLADQMRVLWESQNEVIKITEAAKEIVDVLFPQFKEEINEKLAEYEEAYQQYTDKWDEALKKAEDDIAEFGKTLAEGLANQDKAIQDNNAAQLELINTRLGAQDEKLAAQDDKITRLQETTNSKLAQQDQKLEDFINNYNPVRVMLPEVIVTTNEDANITAISPAGERTEKAVLAGTPTTFICPAYGSWTFTAVSQIGTEEQALNIDDVKQYTLTFDIAPPTVYTIDITNSVGFATAARCFNAGVYQITGPNGYSQTFTSAANSTLNVEVDDPGVYTVEWKGANVVPHGDSIVNTGVSRIYTTVWSATAALSPASPSATLYHMPSTMQFIFQGLTLPAEIYITPPTVTERSTSVEVTSSEYHFIPWVTGQWLFGQTDGIEKGYTLTSLTEKTSFSLAPEQLYTPQSVITTVPWPGNITATDTCTITDNQGTINAGHNLRDWYSNLGICICGISRSGQLIGYIFESSGTPATGFKYYYEDGTDFLDDVQYMCIYVPSFDFGLSTEGETEVSGLNYVSGRYTDTNPIFKDFTTKTPHKAIAVSIMGLAKDGTLPLGLTYNTYDWLTDKVTSPTNNNMLPPHAEVARIEQAIFFLSLQAGCTDKNTYTLTIPFPFSRQINITDRPAKYSNESTGLVGIPSVWNVLAVQNYNRFATVEDNVIFECTTKQAYKTNASVIQQHNLYPNSYLRLFMPNTNTNTQDMCYGSSITRSTNTTNPCFVRFNWAGTAFSTQKLFFIAASETHKTSAVFYLD